MYLSPDQITHQHHCSSQSQPQLKRTFSLSKEQNEQPGAVRSIPLVSKWVPLTYQNLKIYTEGSPPHQPSSTASMATTSKGVCTTTSARFGARLHRNNIRFGIDDTVRPENFESVQRFLDRPRASPLPTENNFKTFQRVVAYANCESAVKTGTWRLLATTAQETPGYGSEEHLAWTQVKGPLTTNLSHAKPDISESFREEEYPVEAIEALGGALLPAQHDYAMPRLCIEYKGPNGNILSAEKQCAYDGALMVEAAFQAHDYMGKPRSEFLHNTQALTIATNGLDVRQYANHVLEHNGKHEYHQHHLKTNHPTESLEEFRNTYRRLRNCQDWARESAARTRDDLHAFLATGAESTAPCGNCGDEQSGQCRCGAGQGVTPVPSHPAPKHPSKPAISDQGLRRSSRLRARQSRQT